MKKFLNIITLIFFGLNIVLLWKYNNTKKEINNYKLLNEALNETNIKCEKKLSNININVKNNIFLNNNKISKEILLEDIYGNGLVKLEELVSDGRKIIFRIPKEPCGSCIDRAFNHLKKIEKHKIENVIIFMSDDSPLDRDKYDLTKYGVNTYITSSNLPIEFEKNEKAYFFSIDNTFVTKDGFIPRKSDDEFILKYLNNILK